MNSLTALKQDIRRQANKPQAKFLQRFFKTGRGGYAEGDLFLGIRVPASRLLAKKYPNLSLTETKALLRSKYHEERLIALFILLRQFSKGSESLRTQIYKLYLSSTKYINNWDLVDISAATIVGGHLKTKPRGILEKLAKSKSLWERRIAMISTHRYIYEGEFTDALKIAKILLSDKHDLIHKAVGWMLREVGNRDEKVLRKFLDKYKAQMPRTALRYAIEKFPEKLRQSYLAK